jgi:4-hydroxy-2-oxoheptanedioate aldolase
MARKNKVIQRLLDGETVFATPPTGNGAFRQLAQLARSRYDMVMIEMEHEGFDLPLLSSSLQHLLNRRRILESGGVIDPAPLVRIPPYAREGNEWIVKQVLDAGAMGLVLPHLDSVEGAQAAVRAARYPQPRGAAGQDPPGLRGWAPSNAAEYWGISTQEYYERAGVWPLDADGEILLMGMVESVAGLAALPAILKSTRGIGAIWAGLGDLAVSMGLSGDTDHPEVEAELLRILAICKDHGVACGALTSRNADVEMRIAQGFEIVVVPPVRYFDELERGLRSVGRDA